MLMLMLMLIIVVCNFNLFSKLINVEVNN